MTKTIIVIPARLESSRLYGKPMANILGLPMIVRVAKNAKASLLASEVIVATDSEEICDVLRSYDIDYVMTGECATGTDRVLEAVDGKEFDCIVNLQGDEPTILSWMIDECIQSHFDNNFSVVNMISELSDLELEDQNVVKSSRENGLIKELSRGRIKDSLTFKQNGLYVFSKKSLLEFGVMPQTENEKLCGIEMTRLLDNKIDIISTFIQAKTVSVDTTDDVIKACNELIRRKSVFMFDVDETISDNKKQIEESYSMILSSRNINGEVPTGCNLFDILSRIKGEYQLTESIEELAKERACYYKQRLISTECGINADSLSAIKSLRKSSIVFYVSSSHQDFTDLIIGENRNLFCGKINWSEGKEKKPSPDLYREALRLYGGNRNNCIAIEDSISGIVSAIDSGIEVVAVPSSDEAKEFCEARGVFMIENMLELKKIKRGF